MDATAGIYQRHNSQSTAAPASYMDVGAVVPLPACSNTVGTPSRLTAMTVPSQQMAGLPFDATCGPYSAPADDSSLVACTTGALAPMAAISPAYSPFSTAASAPATTVSAPPPVYSPSGVQTF
ncbi:hypothetical protein H4R19_006552, partial [Coemansia spiralis]